MLSQPRMHNISTHGQMHMIREKRTPVSNSANAHCNSGLVLLTGFDLDHTKSLTLVLARFYSSSFVENATCLIGICLPGSLNAIKLLIRNRNQFLTQIIRYFGGEKKNVHAENAVQLRYRVLRRKNRMAKKEFKYCQS
ncbi:hypothetical protein VNO78_04372 [Psophocarpus tetragonolobus]|uniref:Uncharacterized protein n=1 Tax=Psophocarpus tetragonolobus TaxID=3891 RepID=A0AAN9T2E7_PSOTE